MKERYHVTGMSCSACSSHVEKAVNKLENVEKASVNLLTETMDVTHLSNYSILNELPYTPPNFLRITSCITITY